MRIVGAVLVTIAILGGLNGFFHYRNQRRASRAPTQRLVRASQDYTMHVTVPFDAAPDEYALDPAQTASLLVENRGNRVYAQREPIAAGTTVQIALADQLTIGQNELFVRVTPAADATSRHHAIRVQVVRGDSLIVAESSFWSEDRAPVQGAVRVPIREEHLEESAS